jgi:hypothetical protein
MQRLLTTLALISTSFVAGAADLYLEDFSNTANGTNFNTGWNLGNADALMTSLVVDGSGLRHEAWSQSNLAVLAPVGNNPVPGGTDYGSPFTPFNGGTSRFMYTLEVGALNLTVDDVKAFQADIRKRTNSNQVWFGILTGNKWYFSQNTVNTILDDETGDPDYYRYVVPMTNMVEINQVWDNGTGWGVARTALGADVVGPAAITGSDMIQGFAMLFTTQIAQTGNMYIDNLGLSSVPEPATYALLFGAATLGLVILRRRR